MRLFSMLARVIAGVVLGFWDFLKTVLGGFIGSFQPAPWMQAVGKLAEDIIHKIRAVVLANPQRSSVLTLMLLLIIGGGLWGWQWWQAQPKPLTVQVTATAPENLCYSCDAPYDKKIPPLVLQFSESVAPLDVIEQELKVQKNQPQLRPAIAGSWFWKDDKTLHFLPTKPWPIGKKYVVEIPRKGTIAPQIVLDTYAPEFTTEAFVLKQIQSVFYQDPVNSRDQHAVFTLTFNHPVKPASLESKLSLRYFDRVTDDKESELTAPGFTVIWDAKRLEATVHSAILPMPENAGRLHLQLASGVEAMADAQTVVATTSDVTIPGRYALAVASMKAVVGRDADESPRQVITLELSHSTTETAVKKSVQAWLLPLRHPNPETQAAFERKFSPYTNQPFAWNDVSVSQEMLTKANSIPLSLDSIENEHNTLHSFGHTAGPGRYIVIKISKGMSSFGGYELAKTVEQTLKIPEFPQEIRITERGSLLSMSGNKTLTVFTRDVPGLRLEIGRLLPQQIQHLVTQSNNTYENPGFNGWAFDADNITERFTKVVALPKVARGVAQYQAIDLSEYLLKDGANQRGIFLLKVDPYNIETQSVINISSSPELGEDYPVHGNDSRMIVITDLGLIVKRNSDESQEVFVQSIANGQPMANVSISVIAKNGEALISRVTDGSGHAQFPPLKGFERERSPVLYLATLGGDQSFLPINSYSRALDQSRFDIGGVSQSTSPGALSAFMFSDRGMYRPGETARLGVVVRTVNFSGALPGIALEYEVTDPQGILVSKFIRPIPSAGLDELTVPISNRLPTGEYSVYAYLPANAQGYRESVGSMTFVVREFQPDRLKLRLGFSSESAKGWITPEDLQATIDLQNLFGTPAQNRKVTSTLSLSPWLPDFVGYSDYQFFDPSTAREGFNEDLPEVSTDANGKAAIILNLKRFAHASYRVHVVSQGFEPDGGRGVTAEAAQVVSNLPYLIGWKPDGDFNFIAAKSKRSARLIALGPDGNRVAVKGLKSRHFERKFVSVLIKRDNGTYQYESRQKDTLLSESDLALPGKDLELPLNTDAAGTYFYQIVDSDKQVFANVLYSVVGAGNVSRSLDKNAELQLQLNKADFAPGQEIEISIVAPYTGAGLITIEREKVLAHQWFTASTTASVQKIKIPEGLEGSAYVNVIFTRDPSSEVVRTSPMSAGVVPFSVAIDARRSPLTLTSPERIKPGDTLTLTVAAEAPGKAVVYVVDEGILQVARYQTPDPLAFFFQKRSLDVTTYQILDLILPEFRPVVNAAAPGGDADGSLGRHLNPFRRKGEPPVAWWSGVIDVGSTPKTLTWTVPDTFNGSLRVMAVSVDSARIGVTQAKTAVRGDFTLTPNAPLTITPGDEFEISTGVANNLETSAKDAPIEVSVTPSPGVELLSPATQSIKLSYRSEGLLRWKVRAKDLPGAADIRFVARYSGRSANSRISMSLRPVMPYRVDISALEVRPNSSQNFSLPRSMYGAYAKEQASIGPLPLTLAHSLSAYLADYPYYCTEQLVSSAVPALILSKRPELLSKRQNGEAIDFAGVIGELATRQTENGDYRMWPNGESVEFVSVYAQHFMLEALERGRTVDVSIGSRGNDFLMTLARRAPQNLEQARNSAYAIYLLTRQGQVLSSEADGLHSALKANFTKGWQEDATAAWLAASYQLMQQKTLAKNLIVGVNMGGSHFYDRYHGPLATSSELLYIIAKHFPELLPKYGPQYTERLLKLLNEGGYQTLSAATAILALDAYAEANPALALGQLSINGIAADGSVRLLPLPAGLFPQVNVPAALRKLRFTNASALPAYASASQSGFDVKAPDKPVSNGIEVLRTLVGDDGKPVTSVKIGDEVTVRLRVRSTKVALISEVALVDLLPGGFEAVLAAPVPREAVLQQADGEEKSVESEASMGEGGEGASTSGCACQGLTAVRGGMPTFAEFREDRLVVYLDVPTELREFSYRIKAVSAGSFNLPPAYAEAMYDQKTKAFSLAGKIQVVRP